MVNKILSQKHDFLHTPNKTTLLHPLHLLRLIPNSQISKLQPHHKSSIRPPHTSSHTSNKQVAPNATIHSPSKPNPTHTITTHHFHNPRRPTRPTKLPTHRQNIPDRIRRLLPRPRTHRRMVRCTYRRPTRKHPLHRRTQKLPILQRGIKRKGDKTLLQRPAAIRTLQSMVHLRLRPHHRRFLKLRSPAVCEEFPADERGDEGGGY